MPVMDVDRMSEALKPGAEDASRAGGRVAVVGDGNSTVPVRRGRDWRPLAGAALLDRLRITGRPRPEPDPQLVVMLKQGLEEGLVAGEGGSVGPSWQGNTDDGGGGRERIRPAPPLVVTKDRLNRVLACEAHHLAAEFGERQFTTALACGAIIDALFRQLVTVGSIEDPAADGTAALSVDDHQRDLVAWIGRLPDATRDELYAEVERQVGGLLRRWPPLEPSWMPRTQEALRVGLAGGAVQLSARVDLAIGRPVDDRASVAIVEVKSGVRRVEHRSDLHFYALIESLRNPAPPFVVATYYTRTGELDVDPVSEELLVAAARRTLAGIRVLRDPAAGVEPRRTPHGLCGSCAALPDCGLGQRHTASRSRHPLPGGAAR